MKKGIVPDPKSSHVVGESAPEPWVQLLPLLNETQRRFYVAQKALERGRGGPSTVARLTGVSRPTILKGIKALQAGIDAERARTIRKQGGGRKRVEEADPALRRDLELLMEENTAGDPMSCLQWTGKSRRTIARELAALGHAANPNTVGRLLKDLDYALRANVTSVAGAHHPDRDAQFRSINARAKAFLTAGNPVLSVDTKQKELIGNFKNPGRTWRREERHVNAHDFPSDAEGKAIP